MAGVREDIFDIEAGQYMQSICVVKIAGRQRAGKGLLVLILQ